MTINIARTGQLALFEEMRAPGMFLTRQFTMPPGGSYSGEKVFIDIARYGEDVAIVIKKATGPNLNDIDQFTTREFTPPSYGEAFPLDVAELFNRIAGVDPHTAAYNGYAADLVSKMNRGFVAIDAKISRGVELQASQILQTGKLTLGDKDGQTVYDLDFKPKATHFPTTGTAWSNHDTADPEADLLALGRVIRGDGRVEPRRVIMGESAVSNFLANTKVQAKADNRRMIVADFAPELTDTGGVFYGYYWIGNYMVELWSCSDSYTDPATGNPAPYIDPDAAIMIGQNCRLDITSAMVPLPLGPDPRVADLIPGRMVSRSQGFDVTPNVYCSNNGKQIMGELESRTLLIPVQIDGFGCLTTS